MSRAQRGPLATALGQQEPYELKELAEVITLRWRVPKKPRTAIGRNCSLFAQLMRFAG